MARRPLTPEAEREVARFAFNFQKYAEARRTAYERAKIAADAEVAALKLEAARAGQLALSQGASKRSLSDVMRTKDYRTVSELLSAASPIIAEVDERATIPSGNPSATAKPITLERLTGTAFRVELASDELEIALTRADWTSGKTIPAEARAAEVTRAGDRFAPLTEAWMEEEAEQHPVVAWLSMSTSQEKLTAIYAEMEGK